MVVFTNEPIIIPIIIAIKSLTNRLFFNFDTGIPPFKIRYEEKLTNIHIHLGD